MGFEQLNCSPPQSAAWQQQSPEKHKLISYSKQDKSIYVVIGSVVQQITW